MSGLDEVQGRQKIADLGAHKKLNKFFAAVGLVAISLGAADMLEKTTLTFDDFKAEQEARIAKSVIQSQMDSSINNMRDEYLKAARENQNIDFLVPLKASDTNLVVNTAEVRQQLTREYNSLLAGRKTIGGALAVMGGVIVSLSALAIRRNNREIKALEASAAPAASGPS